MYEPFDLPAALKGEELPFPAHLQQVGTHMIVVEVCGQAAYLEPDEERNYRAIVEDGQLNKQVTIKLLKAIAEAIEDIVK